MRLPFDLRWPSCPLSSSICSTIATCQALTSQLNIAYYASLANFYAIYDLRRFKPGQTKLYLLCYAWQRYRRITDIWWKPLACFKTAWQAPRGYRVLSEGHGIYEDRQSEK